MATMAEQHGGADGSGGPAGAPGHGEYDGMDSNFKFQPNSL